MKKQSGPKKHKNVLLTDAIKKKGYRVGEPFSKLVGISYNCSLLPFIKNELGPFDSDHNLIPSAEKLCIFLHKLPNKLWPEELLNPFKEDSKEFEEICIDSLEEEYSELTDGISQLMLLEKLNILEQGIDGLTEREIVVLKMRFGLDCEESTCRAIADIYGVCDSRIHQIEKQAIRKLRSPLKGLKRLLDY